MELVSMLSMREIAVNIDGEQDGVVSVRLADQRQA
jgi:hypothetical protein